MKAYLLITEWTYASGDHGYDTEILSNWDLARIHMQREIEKTKKELRGALQETSDVNSEVIQAAAEPRDLQWTASLEPDGYIIISLIEHVIVE